MQSQTAIAPSNAQAGAQSIFTAIEAQLLHSEIYQQVLTRVQALSGEAAEAAQTLLASLGKEAVRLAFQTISQQYKVVPTEVKQAVRQAQTRPVAAPSRHLNAVATPEQPAQPCQTSNLSRPVQNNSKMANPAIQPISTPQKTPKFRRLSKAERARHFIQEREAICREIGSTLRQARESQGISIGQLYSKTLVQVFYIKAIESGRVEQLPEDIYLRGFIRRLGNALGLDGSALVKGLPKHANDSPVPSWYSPEMKNAHKSIGGVTSLHMYAGYTAAMATAIGGLSWVTSPQQPVYAQPEVEPDTAQTESSFQQAEQAVDLEQQASAAIAPPEAL